MAKISPVSLIRNGEVTTTRVSEAELREHLKHELLSSVRKVEELARGEQVSFRDAELLIREGVYGVGRLLLTLFLALREEHVVAQLPEGRVTWFGRVFRRRPAVARNLSTLFGTVRYWRVYMRDVSGNGSGYHPLDLSLGLGVDRFSWNVLSRAVRLATELSFAGAKEVLGDFVPNTPSTEVIEQAMLGFGAHAEAFFEMQPPPADDGEVLVIEVDGKAVPTATAHELAKRRGKRKPKRVGAETSARHRGRHKRSRNPKGPRRKKGDKSKNGKGGTMVVMYTLRRCGTRRLEGPLNKRHYVTFASKRRAFEVAQREAIKRGFGPTSGRVVQLVTDGDDDLARLRTEYLPHAEHTIDVYHVIEKLWNAAGALFREGSPEAKAWVDEQKERLFDDDAEGVLKEFDRRLARIAKTGPGTKSKRDRLNASRNYITKRVLHIRYGSLRRRDLVIGSGVVEGAIKFVLAKRCDHGGMRWIKERVQAVAQLRCIVVNGDWEAFERFVHKRQRVAAVINASPSRIQQPQAQELRHAA